MTKWERSLSLVLLTSVLSGCWSCTDFRKQEGCTCEGNRGQTKITCGPSATFTSLSGLFPTHTRELTVTPGNIKNLRASDFDGLDKLERLNLDSNLLTTIDFNALSGLQNLKYLSLKRNNITYVKNSKSGLTLNKLEKIALHSNKISSLGPFSVPDLPKLISFNFKANVITRISKNAFGTVKRNSEVVLENNPLRCNCMIDFKIWAEENGVNLLNAVCTEDGIELPNRKQFDSCSERSDDNSKETFQCYLCESTRNEEDCEVQDCDLGQNQCLTETEEIEGVDYITKHCLTRDECFDRFTSGQGSKTAKCCSGYLCNGKAIETVLLCEGETERNEKGFFEWQNTFVDATDTVPCPGDRSTSALRRCIKHEGGAKWENPNDANCPEATEITEELAVILDTFFTDENVVSLSERLENVSRRCPEYNPMDVDHTVGIVQRLLRYGPGNQERETIGNCVSALNNLFLTPQERLVDAERRYKSAQKYLTTVDDFGTMVNLERNNGIVKEVRRNLAIMTVTINQTYFREINIEAEKLLSTENSISFQDRTVSDGKAPIDTISLPDTIFSGFQDKPRPGGDRATFVVYQQDVIFKVIAFTARGSDGNDSESKNSTGLDVVNSRIMSASIGNLTLRNLTDPILITFNHQRKNSTKQPRCVFWDFKNNTWSSEGCAIKETVNSSYTVCQCDHLTNFALLLDVYDTGSSGTNKQAEEILSLLSFIGCAVSFFGLVLTIVIYCIFSKLRKDVPSKILLNLCVALACLNVTFIIGVYSLDNPDLCKAIAVLMHYFLLSSMAWMSVEAFYMYLALVLVFRTYIQRFMLKAMLIAWGIPLVIVAITLGINNTNNYGSQINNKICWLGRIPFFAAALAPVALVLLGNMIIFGLVIKQICGMSSQKLNKSETISALQQLRGIIGVFILLGITWTFAIFAIGEASLAFQFLFAIFNSLQGLFIFIFYCLMKADVQKRLFCCCPSTFDPSTSSQKSSKETYSTSGRGRSTFRSAISSVFATNIKKRGSRDEPCVNVDSAPNLHKKIPPDLSQKNQTEPSEPPSYDSLHLGVLY